MKETRNVRINVSSNVGTQMNKGTVASKGLSASLKGVASSASLATGGIRAMTMALVSSGIGIAVVALGSLIGGIATVINKSKQFASQMSTLNAVLGDKGTAEVMQKLSADAKRLGASTAFTAKQVGELQTEFAKLGFSETEILNVTEATLSLAAASGTDLANAAMVAGATLRGLGLESDQTGRVADVMAMSFSKSGLNIENFQESMKLVAPTAANMKVSLEQATAALSLITDAGIKGSMAGTNLRKVMGDLSLKTGKDFRTSLIMTKEKMDALNSDTEKMALATKLVGQRAKDTLSILVKNIDTLDDLEAAYENAGGAAAVMAEEKLNNLEGDLVKLTSAWEGFILGVDDGGGIISKVARGAVQRLTDALGGLGDISDWVGMKMNSVGTMFKMGAARAGGLFNSIKLLGLQFKKFGLEALMSLEGVPFLGAVVPANAAARIRATESEMSTTMNKMKAWDRVYNKFKEQKDDDYNNFKNRKTIRSAKQEAEIKKQEHQKFLEDKAKKDAAASKKNAADRKKFLEKLRKLEQDSEDQTELDKIRRKRQRHLEELNTISMNKKQKRDVEMRINAVYDALEAEQKVKNKEKFEKLFGAEDPIDEINKKQEAHISEMSFLELSETEKQEMLLRINNHYQGLREKAQQAIDDKKAKDIEEDYNNAVAARDAKLQLAMGALDSAAAMAGEETEIARALHAVKLTMQLSELAMKMGIIKDELKIKAQAAMSEAGIEGAKVGTAIAGGMAETSKVGFPWNVITMASYALQAATMIKSFASSKKKLGGIAAKAGASGSSGGGSAQVQAPSFNVIGRASAGDNMVADTIAQVNSSPMRAYVVESDVTSAQSAQRATEDVASMG